MGELKRLLAVAVIICCLIGVAYAGANSNTTDEGAYSDPPYFALELNDEDDAGVPQEPDPSVSLQALIQQNSDARIMIGDAEIPFEGTGQIPVSVADLSGVTGVGFHIFFDSWLIDIEDVVAAPGLPSNVTYNVTYWDGEEHDYYTGPQNRHGSLLSVAVTIPSDPPLDIGTTPEDIVLITVSARPDEYGEAWLDFDWAEWSPGFGAVEFAEDKMHSGVVTVLPPELPDLTGYLDPAPPEYVKKYKNGTVFLDPTFVIWNVGRADVNTSFDVEVTLATYSATRRITDPQFIRSIGPNEFYHINTKVTLDPERTKDDNFTIISDSEGRFVGYIILTNRDLPRGNHNVAININSKPDFDEITFDNNTVMQNINVTYPDLRPVLEISSVQSQPRKSDPKEIARIDTLEEHEPGWYTVTYGVKNIGNVYAVPTWLTVTQGSTVLYNDYVDFIEPGDNWTQTKEIQLSRTTPSTTFTVEVNADVPETGEPTEVILHPDESKKSRTIDTEYQVYDAVTLVFPEIEGSTDDPAWLNIALTNISAGAHVGSFRIPVIFDPTVCYWDGTFETVYTGDVTVKSDGYGRLLVEGSNLDLASDQEVIRLRFVARSDSGRKEAISSRESETNTWVKTTEGTYLLFDFTPGSFTQTIERDAVVSLWAPTAGSADQNVAFSVTVRNTRAAPVTVDADLKATLNGGSTEVWNKTDIELGAFQSLTFRDNSWTPTSGDYQLNASIIYYVDAQNQTTKSKSSVRQIRIDPYRINITDQNWNSWEQWYGFNRSVVQNNPVMIGTYFTANQPGQVNATLRIWYPGNGSEIDLTKNHPIQMSSWNPAKRTIYGYNSNWNSAIWYSIVPRELGTFNYTIELEARGASDFVNGTLVVREPNADIKVLNFTSIENQTDGAFEFKVFNREIFEDRRVEIVASAGAEGRTLSGLEYLIGYPHGCPEQAMSPALATLRVKQYYANRGGLTDERNETFRRNMLRAYDMHKATSSNNPQKLFLDEDHSWYGSWAWGRTSSPTFFYTLYPNYVFTELWLDMEEDPTYWGFDLTNTSEINLTASTEWMIDRQRADGGWQEWGYVSNRYEWTGWVSEKFVREFGFLTPDGKMMVNESLNESYRFLFGGDYSREPTKAVAFGIYGLTAIKEHYEENTTIADQVDNKTNDHLVPRLMELRQGNAEDGFFWRDGWYNDAEATAHAVLALNRSGLPADNETVLGGIRWLVSQYDTNGRWGNTRATASVVNTLTQVQIPATVDFTADIALYRVVENGDDTLVWEEKNLKFDDDNVRERFSLTSDQIRTLYNDPTPGNYTGEIRISNKADTGDVSKLVVSVQSLQKVPLSVALATIPEVYIDPIADDFFLAVGLPEMDDPGLIVGSEVDVIFQANNSVYKDGMLYYSQDQNVMILEIPISAAVNFTGSDEGNDAAYFIAAAEDPEPAGEKVYLNHMVNRTAGKLYVYPGSNNESRPSLVAGEVRNFHVNLTFAEAGSQTVEARLYPMYGSPNAPEHGDEWMALADVTTYVKGYGNITLSAVNETGAPVNANFYIAGEKVADSQTNVTVQKLETRAEFGDSPYRVAIQRADGTNDRWINTTLHVPVGEVTEYSAMFVDNTNVPHIITVVGASGDVLVMPPEVEETISEASMHHWNRVVPARTIMNSTVSSSGGIATIAVDVPVVNRTLNNGMVWSVPVHEKVRVAVRNSSGWYDYTGFTEVQGGQLILYNVNTADILDISVQFHGRLMGDINNDGVIDIEDAFRIAQRRHFDLTENDRFYADVLNEGELNIEHAYRIAQRRHFDEYYQ